LLSEGSKAKGLAISTRSKPFILPLFAFLFAPSVQNCFLSVLASHQLASYLLLASSPSVSEATPL
jgi:hypothetical protein